MTLLTKIAKALHEFGSAQDPSAVTRVSFDLSCSLSDLELPSEPGSEVPETSTEWVLKVTLSGMGTSSVEVDYKPWPFDQAWSGIGSSEHEAVLSVWYSIACTLQYYLDAQSKSVSIVSETLRVMNEGKSGVPDFQLPTQEEPSLEG